MARSGRILLRWRLALVSLAAALPALGSAPGESAPPAGAAARDAAPAPRLEIDRERVDLGVVSDATEPEAVFTLRNAGEAELAILEAKPS